MLYSTLQDSHIKYRFLNRSFIASKYRIPKKLQTFQLISIFLRILQYIYNREKTYENGNETRFSLTPFLEGTIAS